MRRNYKNARRIIDSVEQQAKFEENKFFKELYKIERSYESDSAIMNYIFSHLLRLSNYI